MTLITSASNSPPGAMAHSALGHGMATSSAEPPTAAQWFEQDVLPMEGQLRGWLERQHPALKGDLDDIIQESYFRLIRAREGSSIRCLRTYLYGIARHVAMGLHRDQRKIAFKTVSELPEAETIFPDGDIAKIVDRRQNLALTAEAIQTLPERCREIVLLHTVEGLSYRAIALKLDIAEETVRVQMARAVRKCIEFLRRHTP